MEAGGGGEGVGGGGRGERRGVCTISRVHVYVE